MDKQVNRFRLEGDKRKKAKGLRVELSLEHTVTCERPWVQFSVWQVRGGGAEAESRGVRAGEFGLEGQGRMIKL